MLKKNIKKECLLCGEEFTTHTGRKLYCGSAVKRQGCSFMNALAHSRKSKEKLRGKPSRNNTREIYLK